MKAIDKSKVLLLTKFGRDLLDDKFDIIFLNQRCLSCTEIVENNAAYITYPDIKETIYELETYEDKVFCDVMKYLSPILSELNDVKYSEKYWMYYISFEFDILFWSYYYMFIQIKNVIEKYPNIKIVCFEDNQYDIAQLNIYTAKYKPYMLQLIGKHILSALNYKELHVIKINDYFSEKKETEAPLRDAWGFRDIFRRGYDWIYKSFSQNANYIATYSFSNNIRKLQRRLIGSVYFCGNPQKAKKTDGFVDVRMRKKLMEKMSVDIGEDQFENIFLQNIVFDLSLNYLENYKKISKTTRYLKKMNFNCFIKFLYSTESLEYAAYIKEVGGKIVECSHSIEEGWQMWKPLIMKEADYFLAWSKENYLPEKKYIECISYMIPVVKQVNYLDNENILYARGQETSPYPEVSGSLIFNQRINMRETVLRPVRFYEELGINIRNRMVYRNRDEWEEGSRELMVRYCPEVQFDDSFTNGRQVSFVEQVKKSRIVVVESVYSTSFFQSIMYGVPTIIIQNIDYKGLLNDKVLELLEKLKQVDVWFTDAATAGKVICENYDKIDEWWNMPARRELIQKIQSQLWVSLDGKTESEWWKETLHKLT